MVNKYYLTTASQRLVCYMTNEVCVVLQAELCSLAADSKEEIYTFFSILAITYRFGVSEYNEFYYYYSRDPCINCLSLI